MGKFEDYLKSKQQSKKPSDAKASTANSNSSSEKTSSRFNDYLASKEAARNSKGTESFKFGGKTYIYDKESGTTKKGFDPYKQQKSFDRSVKDRKSYLETGHETLLSDLGQMAEGTLQRQGANYLGAATTAGLYKASLWGLSGNYEPEKDSILWKMNQVASANSKASSDLLADSKEGRTKFGQTMMDVGSSAIDVAVDQALSFLIPGAGMAAMSVRSFGGASQEAREQGKSVSTQMLTGLKSAAIEYFTEKMWGIGGRKGANGTGYIERLTKHWENNLIEKGVPAIVEKIGAAFGSEAIEEMMSDVLNPIVDKGLSVISKKLGGDYEESGFPALTEILYDGLVGGLVGLGGGMSEGVNLQREINSAGSVNNWVTAERQQDQMKADKYALDMVKEKMATKDGKAKMGKLARAKVANLFSTERGIKTGNEMADDFFKAWEEVKVEEFKDPAKALGKVIEKYEEKRIAKLAKSNTQEVADSETAQYIDTERTDEENAATTELLRGGIEPEAPQAPVAPATEEEYTDYGDKPFTYGEETNGAQELRRDDEGRSQPDVQFRGERPENRTVSPDNEGTQYSDQGRNGAENQRANSEVQEVSPNDRVNDAVRKTVNKRFGELANGEVNEQKASSRREHAQSVLKQAGINDDVSKALLQLYSDDMKYGYMMAAEGNIEETIKDADALNAYYEGLASTALLGAIAEGDSPSLINVFREAGMSDEQAKLALGMVRKALMNEGYFSEANVNASKRNGTFNPNAQRSATRADYSGNKKTTANITDYNPDFGKAETITFDKETYKPKPSDKVIGRETTGKQTGYLKNTSLKSNHYYDVVMRSMDNYVLVDEEGRMSDPFDEREKAFAAAKGTSSTYTEARVKLASGMFADYSNGKWMTLDLNNVYNKETYRKSVEDGDRFSPVRYMTRNRSHASDLMGVKYSTYKDAKTTTESLTVDLRGANQDDVANFLKKVIDLTASGNGIEATNGKTYVFAGQTASMRKNGVIQLMEKSAYDKCRERMMGFLEPNEVKNANPSKYLANLGFMFTPSNDDTNVKIKDCVVLPDYTVKRRDVTNNFIVTDMTNDRIELEKLLGKAGADKVMANAKTGFIESIVFDLLESNSTDGFGFVWSDKQQSFQMRSVGGIKGLLQGFDFYKYLSDNLPTGTESDPKSFPHDADYFYKASNGDVWAKDRWGIWVNLKGKKALLFESTVKFASSYGDGQEGHDRFYSDKMSDQDIRSVPRENVYGSNADAGMVAEMKRRGLTQFLRTQYGFTDSEIKDIADYYLLDIEDRIMNNPDLLAKMFAADFGAIKSDSSSFESVMVSLLGEKFFGTPLGQKWAVKKLSKIAEDFKAGKLYMTQDESYYGWIAPDVIGLFNGMANISYKGYAGLAEGKIYNQRLQQGNTIIGRNPSAETNDVQVRYNKKEKAYEDLVSEYGLDPEITLLALSDNLGLHLDNDYDGDTATLYQGLLGKTIDAIRSKAKEQGKDYSKATLFTHKDAKAGEKGITVDTIVGAVKLGMDADPVGIFDNAIDILNAISDKEIQTALDSFKGSDDKFEAEYADYSVDAFRDLMIARFTAAYKFNFDFAKQGYYPAEFRSVVNSTLDMIDDILYANDYAVNWADSKNEIASKDTAAYENGRRKKVKNSAYAVPETWQYSSNPNKLAAYERAYEEELKTGKKYILRDGENALAKMNKAVDLTAHNKKLVSRFGKANSNSEKYSFSNLLSTYNPDKVSSFGMTAENAKFAAKTAMKMANDVYADSTIPDSQKSKKAQEVLYKLQKSLNFNNEQFTSFMLYALEVGSDSAGVDGKPSVQTLFNLNQKQFDKNSTEPSTAEILLRNAKMALTYKSYNDAILRNQQISSKILELKETLSNAKEMTKENEAAYTRMMALKNVVDNANTELRSLQKRLDEISEERDSYRRRQYLAMEEEGDYELSRQYAGAFNAVTREYRDIMAQFNAIRYDENNLSAFAEYKELQSQLEDFMELADIQMEELPELEESLKESNKWLSKNKGFYDDMLKRAKYYGNEQMMPNSTDTDFSEFTEAYQNSDFYKFAQDKGTVTKPAFEEYMNSTSEQEAPTEAPANEAPKPATDNSKKENWKRAVTNFGAAHKDVSNAVKYLANNKGERIGPLKKAFTNINNGVTTDLTEAIKAYDNLRGTEYYTDELYEDLKRAQRKFETDTNPSARANAVATIARMIGHYISQQDATTAELNKANEQMKPVAYNYDQHGILGKLRGKLTRFQYTPQTMFKRIFGYDPDSIGYKLANEVETATKEYMALISRGNSFYNEVAKQDGYEDFFNDKTKLSDLKTDKNKWRYDAIAKAFGDDFNNISANEALYVLSAYEELKNFRTTGGKDKLNPYYNPYWVKGLTLSNGKTINFDYSQDGMEKTVRDGFDALRHVVEDSKLLSDYKIAMQNMLDTYGKFGADVATNVYGVQKKNYNNMPLFWTTYDENGNVVEQSSHNEWDAEQYIKDPSVNVPYSKDANNYLQVRPITKVVSSYIEKMSDFIANKEFRDYITRLNAKRGNGKNLADIVGENYGADYAKWINNYVDDITLNRESDSFLRDVRIALQKGALIGNPSTIIKQSSSYWSAAGILSMKSLMKARSKRFTAMNAGADTDVARFRLFTKAMAPELNEILEKNDTAVDKALNKLPGFSFLKNGITWMDTVTVNNLFTATVFDCLENNPQLDPASDEFREKVMDKYEEVVIYTQPMFNKMIRAEYGRTQDEAIRMLSMFRTQQTQNLNRLATTIGEYQYAKKNGLDTAESIKALSETIKGQGMAAMSVAVFTILADMFKHKWRKYRDDDGNIAPEKITERFVFNAVEAAAGTSWFADELAKVAIDALSGGDTNESYGISMGIVSSANSALDALTTFAKDKSLSSARYAAGYMAQLFGIPLNNMYSYLNTFAMTIAELTGQNPKDYDDIIKLAETNNKIDKNLKPAQKALMDLGMSKKEANNYLKGIDVNDNGKLSQEEIENLYYDHPESAGTLQALWDMQDWSKSFSQMTEAAEKKRTYNSNPLYEAMDEDESGSVTKSELVNYYLEHKDDADIGRYGKGNIDLYARNTNLYDDDGNLMTVKSMSFEEDGKEILIPTVVNKNGNWVELNEDEAIDWYHKTGQYLGKFNSVEEADAYADKLHNQQADLYGEDFYAEMEKLYKEQGFKGTFRSAIKSAESRKLKEQAEDAFYEGDYNVLFDTVSQMKNGKSYLTNLIKDEYDEYDNVSNPLVRYMIDAKRPTKEIDAAVEEYGTKKLIPQYKALRSSGLSPSQAIQKLDSFDANANGSITQQELADYYKAHKDEEKTIAEFWKACGWSTSWSTYKKRKKLK